MLFVVGEPSGDRFRLFTGNKSAWHTASAVFDLFKDLLFRQVGTDVFQIRPHAALQLIAVAASAVLLIHGFRVDFTARLFILI